MAELEYGVVRGRYRLVQSNVSRSAEGSVTFTPVEPDEIVDVPGETLFSRQKVDAVFDGDGWIHALGTPVDYLRLPVGRWEVSFRQAKGLTIGTFQFDVTADETVNLPAVAPIKPSPAVKFVVNELVYTETLDARDETFVARDVAVQAAADAVAPTNTVVDARIALKRGAANGVAALGSDSKLPETQVPDRLSASALSSTFAPVSVKETVDTGRLSQPTLAATIDAAAQQRALELLDGMAVTSGPDVAAIGDSRTAGAGGNGTTWPGALQDILVRAYSKPGAVRNVGVGGENTPTITGRALLGTPWVATVVGGVIPTSGGVTVTLTSSTGAAVAPLVQGSAGVNPVRIAGVQGTLSLSGSTYTFTPTIAPSAPVPAAGAQPVSTQAQRDRQSDIAVIMTGQNDAPQSADTIIAYLAPSILRLKALRKRWIVVGLDTGTASGRAAMEARLAQEYGDRFLNIRAYMATTAALVAEGIVPTADDNTAIAAGSVPPSFWASTSDSIHRNAAGYRRYGRAIYEKIRALGWNDAWGTLGNDADTTSPIIFYDDFSHRANWSSIPTTLTELGQKTWGVQGAGAITVDAGSLAMAPSGAEIFATVNAGATNGRLRAKLTARGASSPFVGLVFRLSATNTYGIVRGHPTGGVWRLSKIVGGTATDLVTTSVPVAAGDELDLVMNGNQYVLKINGVSVADVTDAAGSLTGSTYGFYGATATAAQRWASIRMDVS